MADVGEWISVHGRRLRVERVERTPSGVRLHVSYPDDAPKPKPSPAAADDGPLEGVVQLPTWDQLTYDLEPLALELARLHRPDRDWECTGCDYTGWWPCQTADLVLKHLGYEPDSTRGYGRTVVRVDDDRG